MDAQYPPNSKTSKTAREMAEETTAPDLKQQDKEVEERVKLKPVVTGKVQERKVPWGRRLMGHFTGDDSRTVANYVGSEVLLPAFKNMVTEAVSQGVERMMFGEVRARSPRSTSYTPYGQYSKTGPARVEPREISHRSRSTHDFREVVLQDRAEAEEVLDRLVETIDRYGVATVADYYDLVSISSSWTDQKWGWETLRDARARPVRGGYLIELPRTVQLA